MYMENKVTTTGINPRVSYTTGGKFARNGSTMTIVTLKSILERCASDFAIYKSAINKDSLNKILTMIDIL